MKNLIIMLLVGLITILLLPKTGATYSEITPKFELQDTQIGMLTPNTNIQIYSLEKVIDKWGASEWKAFNEIITKESGWCSTRWNQMQECPDKAPRENPTNGSNAFGLGQTMVSVHDVPDTFFDSPREQIDWTINYIKLNYETPTKALIFHHENNSY